MKKKQYLDIMSLWYSGEDSSMILALQMSKNFKEMDSFNMFWNMLSDSWREGFEKFVLSIEMKEIGRGRKSHEPRVECDICGYLFIIEWDYSTRELWLITQRDGDGETVYYGGIADTTRSVRYGIGCFMNDVIKVIKVIFLNEILN